MSSLLRHTIISQFNSQTETLNISLLATGSYFLKLYDENNMAVYTKEFLKK